MAGCFKLYQLDVRIHPWVWVEQGNKKHSASIPGYYLAGWMSSLQQTIWQTKIPRTVGCQEKLGWGELSWCLKSSTVYGYTVMLDVLQQWKWKDGIEMKLGLHCFYFLQLLHLIGWPHIKYIGQFCWFYTKEKIFAEDVAFHELYFKESQIQN